MICLPRYFSRKLDWKLVSQDSSYLLLWDVGFPAVSQFAVSQYLPFYGSIYYVPVSSQNIAEHLYENSAEKKLGKSRQHIFFCFGAFNKA